jgi:16S rRNA (cytidine1402-2'-O)-methyltransferase
MLYIVATPIGNLEDITLRAKKILSEVGFVLAEDTRRTGNLLKLLEIRKKIVSFHEHSDQGKLNWIIDQLGDDKISAAYVSDAGTPNLSDPGGKLVEAAIKNGIKVVPIPGASALTALISVAPFSCSNFQFLGYFPKKKGREKMVEYIRDQNMPVFFYESPHRIQKTLFFLSERLAGYKVIIGRELTKMHEEVKILDLQDKKEFEKITERGEFALALVRTNKL